MGDATDGASDIDYAELLQLQAAYAAVVDAGDWDGWAELFIDDCRYRLQPRENYDRGLPLATLAFESKACSRIAPTASARPCFTIRTTSATSSGRPACCRARPAGSAARHPMRCSAPSCPSRPPCSTSAATSTRSCERQAACDSQAAWRSTTAS